MAPRVLFAGGGTGGHLYPAIAIADAVRTIAPDAVILFIGTKDKIEAQVVPKCGYAFATIWISGVRRSLSLSTLLVPVKLITALVQSFMHIRRFRPDVVVGTGGYVCGPPAFVANLLGIPVVLQEQNSYPGVTTRLLAHRVRQVYLTFERSQRFLRRQDNTKVSGNPVRSSVGTVSREEGAQRLGIDPSRKTMLVVGGSQGAASINTAVLGAVRDLSAIGVQIIWLTGKGDAGRIRSAVEAQTGLSPIVVLPYLERMEDGYAAADLAVCRSGATTLAELMCAGLPSILVPYPFAAADHQTENARAMVEHGAALLCADSAASTDLGPMMLELFRDPQRLAAMGAAARQAAKPNAAQEIARGLFTIIAARHGG